MQDPSNILGDVKLAPKGKFSQRNKPFTQTQSQVSYRDVVDRLSALPHQFQSYNIQRELEIVSQDQSYKPFDQKYGKVAGVWTAKASGAQSSERMYMFSNKSKSPTA